MQLNLNFWTKIPILKLLWKLYSFSSKNPLFYYFCKEIRLDSHEYSWIQHKNTFRDCWKKYLRKMNDEWEKFLACRKRGFLVWLHKLELGGKFFPLPRFLLYRIFRHKMHWICNASYSKKIFGKETRVYSPLR